MTNGKMADVRTAKKNIIIVPDSIYAFDKWQIELFFKWIKQNLKIKSFLGATKNAVMTQIRVARPAGNQLRSHGGEKQIT